MASKLKMLMILLNDTFWQSFLTIFFADKFWVSYLDCKEKNTALAETAQLCHGSLPCLIQRPCDPLKNSTIFIWLAGLETRKPNCYHCATTSSENLIRAKMKEATKYSWSIFAVLARNKLECFFADIPWSCGLTLSSW